MLNAAVEETCAKWLYPLHTIANTKRAIYAADTISESTRVNIVVSCWLITINKHPSLRLNDGVGELTVQVETDDSMRGN